MQVPGRTLEGQRLDSIGDGSEANRRPSGTLPASARRYRSIGSQSEVNRKRIEPQHAGGYQTRLASPYFVLLGLGGLRLFNRLR